MHLHDMAQRARAAAQQLASCSIEARNHALQQMAAGLEQAKQTIFSANQADADTAADLSAPLRQRLVFQAEKLAQTVAGLHALAALPDPVGQTTMAREISPGLKLYQVTCPIGVIGVIFESRPDALVQIASLTLKTGNAVLLKGGREAAKTNQVLCNVLRQAAASAGLPPDFAQLLETREEVADMLREEGLIDLLIPRGSKEFVRYIMDNSRIPVLGHADGICHQYIDASADVELAIRVAIDSKTQNLSVCNAMETLLVHRDIAPQVLPPLANELQARGTKLLGDNRVQQIISCEPAMDADWATEYLDAVLSIKIVDSLEEAIAHINRYGSHHTDGIISEDQTAVRKFFLEVDSAGVYHNVSTRFADGYIYGLGAEVGIATGKLHARGPMGMEGLTTCKYKLLGHGQTMAAVKDGTLPLTHQTLQEDCPL